MRILKNALSIGAMQVSALVLGVALMPYITRVFGSELLGINSFGMAVVSYFGIAGCLGIPLYGVREVAKHRDSPLALQRVVEMGITYQLFFTLLSTLLYVGWVCLQRSAEMSYLMLFCISMLGTGTDLVWIYGGLECFDRIAIRTVCMRVVATGLVFLLVREPEDFGLFISIQQGAIVLSNAIYWLNLHKMGIRIRFASLRDTLRVMLRPSAFLFIPIALGSIALMLDRVMLGYLAPRSELAIYDYAARLAKIGVTLGAVLGNVMFPRLSNLYASSSKAEFSKAVERLLGAGAIVGVAISGMLYAVATPLCSLLFGMSFLGSDDILRIVALPVFLASMGLYFITISIGREAKLIRSLSISAVVVVVADTLLIPYMGARGAAVGYVLGELALQASYLFFLKDTLRIGKQVRYILHLLLCGAVAAIGANLVLIGSDLVALLVQSAIFASVYLTGLFITSSRARSYMLEAYEVIRNRLAKKSIRNAKQHDA